MILAACLLLGIALRLASGNRLSELGELRLRGESVLLVLLCAQAVLPAMRLSGTAAQVAYWLWLATFPVLVGIAWSNRSYRGMTVAASGLLLNFVVVSINGGMPVMQAAATAAGLQGQLVLAPGDFIHLVGSSATRLPWLADVIALPGPSWMRIVPSAGDVLLYTGVVAFLAGAKPGSPGSRGATA